MGVTAIVWLDNRSTAPVALFDIENSGVPGQGVSVPPGSGLAVNMWIPWAAQAQDFAGKHLELRVNNQTRYWIWQAANADGDFVRFSMDGSWHDRGRRAHGISAVNGDRTLVVRDGCFELLEFPAEAISVLTALYPPGRFRLAGDPVERMVGSVPKQYSVAFSMAGIPSDAYKRGEPGARFRYGDSGKRYRFEIRNGIVAAVHPDGTETVLTQAVSYTRKRAGDPPGGSSSSATAPPFDLIASNGGRVFAKARGMDRFYFATMDHMFIHVRDDGSEFPVPSTYFKLDPEFNQPGAHTDALTRPLERCFFDHPAAIRFPLYSWVLKQNAIDMMVVSVQPQTWHLIDTRPPQGTFNLELIPIEFLRHTILAETTLSQWTSFVDAVKAGIGNREVQNMAPPSGVPVYPQVTYSDGVASFQGVGIDYALVLDIGVGHVHWHEQYEGVTGGELQPLSTGPLLSPPFPAIGYADLYRVFNGPVRDGDGYIDGTCNFYALVQMKNGAYALLYIDEQSYFTKRWRLVDPDDLGGLDMALIKDLAKNPHLYNWNRATFWSPFQAGLIGPQSRLAVSRQVLLVTGVDPDGTTPVIYSINFSFATMDRTWRWRCLPAPARFYDPARSGGADPVIPNDAQDCVYPQTIRLREDMTMHLAGKSNGTVGRWYQRYLPATNQLVPSADQLTSGRPSPGYGHPWKFLPESVFQAADIFSHVGVYDSVDSRMQYYTVQPVSDADSYTLQSVGPGPWVDDAAQLSINAWKFWWAAPLHLVDVNVTPSGVGPPPQRPPSIFNPDVRFKIVRRGSLGWIAMYWDKRDDDLMPLDGLPATVRLRNGDHQVSVTLQSNQWIGAPPTVQTVQCAAPGDRTSPTVMTFHGVFQNVWRIRMAALDHARPGGVVSLLDADIEGEVGPMQGDVSEYRWTPSPAQVSDLQHYCSPDNALRYGTTIWFEDIVGHVSVPEHIEWLRPMNLTVSPVPIQLGAPVALTIEARDALSPSAPMIPATVTIHNYTPGRGWQDVSFPAGQVRTITLQGEDIPGTRPGPHGEPGDGPDYSDPSGTVSAPGYATTDIPFTFVSPPHPRPELAARFVSQSVPASMVAGRSATVSVTMENVGRLAWTRGGSAPYRLGSQNPQDNQVWGLSRVDAPTDVAPGAQGTFSFPISAPPAPGTYNFQWRMVKETVSWFGPDTPNVPIAVVAPQLTVRVDPQPTPMNKALQLTVHAEDATSHAPVAGTVTIDNWVNNKPLSQQFPTNTPFSITLHSHWVRGGRGVPAQEVMPTGTVRASGYPAVTITFDSAEEEGS